MFGESSRRNKQNIRVDLHTKQTQNLVQATVSNLKQQIAAVKLDKLNMQRQYLSEVDVLKMELGEYKKKLSVLTDKYLLETFSKEQIPVQNTQDYEQLIREKGIMLDQERENRKKVEEKLKVAITESVGLKKEVQQVRLEKEKSMEMGLMEKIEIEEKNKLLQEEVNSKKNIINALRKELEKTHCHQETLNKQERNLSQKSKELEYYSQQINEYNRLNELRMKQQLSQLSKENQFLKEYVKKIQKMAKRECQCETKDQKVRENLFQIKRELALAKVKLGQNYFNETRSNRLHGEDTSDNEQGYSFERKK